MQPFFLFSILLIFKEKNNALPTYLITYLPTYLTVVTVMTVMTVVTVGTVVTEVTKNTNLSTKKILQPLT